MSMVDGQTSSSSMSLSSGRPKGERVHRLAAGDLGPGKLGLDTNELATARRLHQKLRLARFAHSNLAQNRVAATPSQKLPETGRWQWPGGHPGSLRSPPDEPK